MSVLAERPFVGEETHSKEPKILVGKARELWDVIASGRTPSADTTAVMDFKLVDTETGIKPKSPEQLQFTGILEKYASSCDLFAVMLKINERYDNPIRAGANSFSFRLAIFTLPAMEIVDTPIVQKDILFVHEYPGTAGLLGFLGRPHVLQIIGWGPEEVWEEPQEYQLTGSNQWEPPYDFYPYGFTRNNMSWRKKFVSEVLGLLTDVGRQVPLDRRADYDLKFQRWMEYSGDPLRV